MKRLVLIAGAAIVAGLLAGACSIDDAAQSPTRLVSPVGPGTLALAKAAVARGEKTVDVGDWSRPDNVAFRSGGEALVGGEIADLFRANGVTARCVGQCGSTLAEIVLNSAGCIVTPNGEVVPHLAFAAGGTPEQNRLAAAASSRWWLERDPAPGAGSARVDLVDRLERSPDGSWRMRSEELRAAGCKI